LAIVARRGGKVVEMGLSIASVAYGSPLGVLAVRSTQKGAILGMLCGFALNIGVWQLRKVPFTWYVALGSLTSFGVGYTASGGLRDSANTMAIDT
jgi:Na+(H+)/acetate symporter ActP